MKRLSKVVRPGHGGKIDNSSGREYPVITDRLRAEDFVFTKVCNLFDYCVDRDVVSKCAFVKFIYNYFIIDFFPSQTSRYGFLYQPTCLAYDPIQSILAVGAYDGSVRMYPFLAEISRDILLQSET